MGPDILKVQSTASFVAGLAIQKSNAESFVRCAVAPLRNPAGDCVVTILVVLAVASWFRTRVRFPKSVRAAARIEHRLAWRSG